MQTLTNEPRQRSSHFYNEVDDETLMERVASQDSKALAALYDRHATLIYSVLMKKLGEPEEAQDILHDVFFKLHTKASKYDPTLGKPSAWLLTMARNTATDKLRRRATHQRYVNKAVHEVPQSMPSHQGPYQDEKDTLNQLLNKLPADQKTTLQLAFYGGFSHQEISDQLSQPLGTIKARIRRGLGKLRECLQGRELLSVR